MRVGGSEVVCFSLISRRIDGFHYVIEFDIHFHKRR
jgi:hypothetical protein